LEVAVDGGIFGDPVAYPAMRHSLVALVPLLVLLAASLAGATAAQSAPGDEPLIVADHGNTTNYLTLPPAAVQATDGATIGMDLGLVVGTDGRTLQTTHAVRTFEDRYRAGDTDANRSAAYDAAIDAIDRRTERLEAHTRTVIAGHAAGSLETGTLLRERAAVSVEAARLQAAVRDLEATDQDRLDYDLPADRELKLANLTGRLAVLQGPVSERTARLAAGGGSPQAVYAESSATGYTLAMMDGDAYVRETYLGAEYDPAAEDQFSSASGNRIERVLERATELYPTTTSEGVGGYGSIGIYRYNAEVAGGQVTVYLDGGSTNAFRESHRVDAETLPVTDTTTAAEGSTTLRVNRTFQTGPMAVTLVDSATGTPLQGTISVNGEPVGKTDSTGQLWTIEPRGQVTIVATTDEDTLRVTLEPAGSDG
jgi:hypothetical protein